MGSQALDVHRLLIFSRCLVRVGAGSDLVLLPCSVPRPAVWGGSGLRSLEQKPRGSVSAGPLPGRSPAPSMTPSLQRGPVLEPRACYGPSAWTWACAGSPGCSPSPRLLLLRCLWQQQ
uniref:Uncharacterized protein n=1 Tax=Rangifer tarandus platyrhynchus TaxID=3082113 RepID=A0ACB0EVE6_RANTA|nr:unnamed protein product [Rangifer tarandus platyrhynchus]